MTGRKRPFLPSPETVAKHNLTHTPFSEWCEVCVQGRARQNQRRRLDDNSFAQRFPLVMIDYTFPYGEEGPPVLNFFDTATGYCSAIPVSSKGVNKFAAARAAEQEEGGHQEVQLQHDGEASILALARVVVAKLGGRCRLRETPKGAVELDQEGRTGTPREAVPTGEVAGRNLNAAGQSLLQCSTQHVVRQKLGCGGCWRSIGKHTPQRQARRKKWERQTAAAEPIGASEPGHGTAVGSSEAERSIETSEVLQQEEHTTAVAANTATSANNFSFFPQRCLKRIPCRRQGEKQDQQKMLETEQ